MSLIEQIVVFSHTQIAHTIDEEANYYSQLNLVNWDTY